MIKDFSLEDSVHAYRLLCVMFTISVSATFIFLFFNVWNIGVILLFASYIFLDGINNSLQRLRDAGYFGEYLFYLPSTKR